MNNDLISRAEAIDIIRSMTISLGGKEIFHPEAKKSVVGALDEIAAVDAEPVRQWTSVKDALPDRQCEYLVRYGFGEPIIKSYSGVMYFVLYDERPHFENESLYGLKVTHWMPLPEPPKEDT